MVEVESMARILMNLRDQVNPEEMKKHINAKAPE